MCLKCPAGFLLSDDMVMEMIQTCFRMSVQTRMSGTTPIYFFHFYFYNCRNTPRRANPPPPKSDSLRSDPRIKTQPKPKRTAAQAGGAYAGGDGAYGVPQQRQLLHTHLAPARGRAPLAGPGAGAPVGLPLRRRTRREYRRVPGRRGRRRQGVHKPARRSLPSHSLGRGERQISRSGATLVTRSSVCLFAHLTDTHDTRTHTTQCRRISPTACRAW